jgi:hypothetical protein
MAGSGDCKLCLGVNGVPCVGQPVDELPGRVSELLQVLPDVMSAVGSDDRVARPLVLGRVCSLADLSVGA